MAAFNLVVLTEEVVLVAGGSTGGCTVYGLAPLAEIFPPVPLTLVVDQEPASGTSSGEVLVSGTVTTSEDVVTATLTINGGNPVGLSLGAGGTFTYTTSAGELTAGINTFVIDAADGDEMVQETLLVGFAPVSLRSDLVLEGRANVYERVPWHLRSQKN